MPCRRQPVKARLSTCGIASVRPASSAGLKAGARRRASKKAKALLNVDPDRKALANREFVAAERRREIDVLQVCGENVLLAAEKLKKLQCWGRLAENRGDRLIRSMAMALSS